MSKFLVINDETFKKFQAALILMGDDEEIVLRELLNEYIHKAFENVMKKTFPMNNIQIPRLKMQRLLVQASKSSSLQIGSEA